MTITLEPKVKNRWTYSTDTRNTLKNLGMFRITVWIQDFFLYLGVGCVVYMPSSNIRDTNTLETCNKANMMDLIAASGRVISNWIQIVDFSARVTLKFDGWPRKTIGHFFYTTSSFVHHFKSICEFKLELQSGNAQFGSKLVIFFNNRAPLLCYFKLCASFQSHR